MSYCIHPLENYPNDNNHLEITLYGICNIRLGMDEFYYINMLGKEAKTDKKNWWVLPDHPCIVRPKAFKEHQDAVKYARTKYLEWCKKEANRMIADLKAMSDLYAIKEPKKRVGTKPAKYRTKNHRAGNK